MQAPVCFRYFKLFGSFNFGFQHQKWTTGSLGFISAVKIPKRMSRTDFSAGFVKFSVVGPLPRTGEPSGTTPLKKALRFMTIIIQGFFKIPHET